MSAVIELKNVSRVYRNGRGLHETTLSVNEGEIIGLLGVNGSGKTTLMKIACGMTRPDTGEAYIGGENVYISPEKALKAVGAVIETPALYQHLSALDNLYVTAGYQGIKDRAQIKKALAWIGFDRKIAKEKVKGFSLGMRQRLALAMAFLGEKKALFLDEPTNGLDIESAAKVKDTIASVCRETGASAIVSSHLAGEIERICTRVVILSGGRIIKDVSMEEATQGGRTLEEFYLSSKEANAQ